MKRLKYNGWRLLIADNISDDLAKNLFDSVVNKSYKIENVLKEHHRSNVFRINWQQKDLVLKIPLEKNERKWIRFLTWFRKGEAFKNILGMLKLWDKGIKSTIPVLAAEKRTFGMVTQSWLVYEYLDGQTCLDHPEYFKDVVAKLSEIHTKGLLHGDPQIRNFVAKDGEIYVIDCNPKSAGYIGFSRAHEFAYLRRSQPEIEEKFGDLRKHWLYRFARWYDLTERKFKEKKRETISKIIKGNK